MKKSYFIYIMTNWKNTVFYIGVTSQLERRVYEHEQGQIKGFTQKYKLKKLVYFEKYDNPIDAIKREKQLKAWHRPWKINLIKSLNPELKNLLDAESSSA